MKNGLKIGITLVVVATLATGGMALAQTDDAGSVDDAPIGTAVAERVRDVLQPLVDGGTISVDQADQVADHLARHRPSRSQAHRRPPVHMDLLAVLGELTVLDGEAVRDALRSGATPAEIAEANGSSRDALIAALTDRLEAGLDAAVADDRLTAEEASQIAVAAGERIAAKVDAGAHQFGRGHRLPGHRSHLGGPDA